MVKVNGRRDHHEIFPTFGVDDSNPYESALADAFEWTYDAWKKKVERESALKEYSCGLGVLILDGTRVTLGYCGSIGIIRSSRAGKKINVTNKPSAPLVYPEILTATSIQESVFKISSFSVELIDGTCFLILASAGLWSRLSNAEIFETTRTCLTKCCDPAKRLLAAALMKDPTCKEDLSIVVVLWGTDTDATFSA